MLNGSRWNFKRSKFNIFGDEVQLKKECCEDLDWKPLKEDEENDGE